MRLGFAAGQYTFTKFGKGRNAKQMQHNQNHLHVILTTNPWLLSLLPLLMIPRNVISLIEAVIIEGVIHDTHRVMSKFMHPIDEEGCEFMLNPRMVDAFYVFR